ISAPLAANITKKNAPRIARTCRPVSCSETNAFLHAGSSLSAEPTRGVTVLGVASSRSWSEEIVDDDAALPRLRVGRGEGEGGRLRRRHVGRGGDVDGNLEGRVGIDADREAAAVERLRHGAGHRRAL